jgi:hypothetical protein
VKDDFYILNTMEDIIELFAIMLLIVILLVCFCLLCLLSLQCIKLIKERQKNKIANSNIDI